MKTAIQHYQDKLSFEMDPSDLFAAFENVISLLFMKSSEHNNQSNSRLKRENLW